MLDENVSLLEFACFRIITAPIHNRQEAFGFEPCVGLNVSRVILRPRNFKIHVIMLVKTFSPIKCNTKSDQTIMLIQ